jgi:hypothetical protein
VECNEDRIRRGRMGAGQRSHSRIDGVRLFGLKD